SRVKSCISMGSIQVRGGIEFLDIRSDLSEMTSGIAREPFRSEHSWLSLAVFREWVWGSRG
ncbi:MAG: hypothetical protein ACK57V_08995, partial [Pirellula sp.]